ncbi:hypothetical protein C2S53_004963 [Perilla frutescens var. hirtella]|uniref:Uncharacterized protein n=1 Tax=Perilla frutescens var. hirtella TaxID=608512 RepID=A0AAD4PCS7_PERFH|nr:hypothetical protein C2S53_004963 [Perilla frutescens var. hirtella]
MRISSALGDQTGCQTTGGGSPFHDARNDDAAADDNGVVEIDDDYDNEADLDVPSEDDEDPFRTGFSNFIPLDCTDSPVHMERKTEFKVPRSYGSRVEYTCKRNPNCTFELRASCRESY